MEEQLKNKMKQQYNFYTKSNKQFMILLSVICIPILIIVAIICGVQTQGWHAIPMLMVKLVIFCLIGIIWFYNIITLPYRRLNRKRYYFFEATVIGKKFVDEHVEFVGNDNEKRYFGKTYYLLLDKDEYYTDSEDWVFHDVRENERYLFASIGSKKRRKCVIVGALKLD